MKGVVVSVDISGKYPRMLEQPTDVYRQRQSANNRPQMDNATKPKQGASAPIACPKCGSDMYDNMKSKPPNYKCKDPNCAHRITLGEDGQLPLGDTRAARKDALREG
jgi:rRNA maturation protein Nop10